MQEPQHRNNPAAPAARLPLRQAVAVGIGNALEFYDFVTFSFFAIQIGHTFFPSSRTSHGLLYSLATFGVGFVTRPVGGIVIGAYADRVGRKPAMMFSFALMGAAILGVALTPSFARIGIAAPLLLLAFRLLQGFALGGEVGPSTAFLIESAPPHRRGFYVSIQTATQGLSILLAGLVGLALSSLLPTEALDEWGWRAAFLLGAAVIPVGLYVRSHLPETLLDSEPLPAPAVRAGVPLRLILLSLLMLGAMTIATYVLAYLNTYAQDSLKLATHLAFGATIITGLCYFIGSPIGGLLSDRIGCKPVALVGMVALLISVIPGYIVMTQLRSVNTLYCVTALLSLPQTIAGAAVMVLITDALPKAIRAGALSTLYAVAIAAFGGSAQFVVKWLVDATHNPLAPAWYMSAALALGVLATLGFRQPPARMTHVAG